MMYLRDCDDYSVVEIISVDCDKSEFLRLAQLGFVKGEIIEVLFKGIFGNIRAYRVKNSVFGLRSEVAGKIKVIKCFGDSDVQ